MGGGGLGGGSPVGGAVAVTRNYWPRVPTMNIITSEAANTEAAPSTTTSLILCDIGGLGVKNGDR